MRILDRYVFRIFAAAFAVSFMAFLALFVVVDFASKIARFFSLDGIPLGPFIAKYYAVRLPLFAHYTLPVVTLIASVFTVIRLSRTNEILPIVASGVSLRRVTLPFLLSALLVGAVGAAIEEYALPRLSEPIAATDDLIVSRKTSYRFVIYGEQGTLVEVGQYDHAKLDMVDVRITQLTRHGRKQIVHVAERGHWDEARRDWILYGGKSYPFDENGDRFLVEKNGRKILQEIPIPPEGRALQTEIRLSDLQLRRRFAGEFLPLVDLVDRSRRLPHVPAFRVQIQTRYSFPVAGLVLLLIGLPFVSAARGHTYLRGLLFCFGIIFAFYAVHFTLLDLGGRGLVDPVAAGWGSTALFGGIGLVLFGRMKT